MPKIISYTPPWLTRPSPGFQLFSEGTSATSNRDSGKTPLRLGNGSRNEKNYLGHRRTIIRRGTEIFVVVNNQIRWSDLCMLRDDWEEQEKSERKSRGLGKSTDGGVRGEGSDIIKASYRVLQFPIGEQIQQLSISPNGTLLAILTSHTVHVVVLPDSSYLGGGRSEPIKVKSYTIGPITHVLSQSRVVRALWHPYGVDGNCLITITAEAVVRVWELNRDNRWSFDSPALAIDLKKLAVGTSEEEDFTPQRSGRNRGFSADSVGMEVVSACFGGTGSSSETAWSGMTLWIAMQDGDLYALCPLLPRKWQPSSTLVPLLSTNIVSKSSLQQDEDSWRQKDQYQWISDIDSQEPALIPGASEVSPQIEIYSRPLYPGPIPRLQGPFQIIPDESEEDLELSDIYVIAATVDEEELMIGEESQSESEAGIEGGLSASVVCLMTRSGSLYLCLDLDGVEGEWLPRNKPRHTLPTTQEFSLVPFEILETLKHETVSNEEWPTFTPDVDSWYSFFVTHSQGVYFFSLDPWVQGLENELHNTSNTGSNFRVNVLKNGPGTLRESLLEFEPRKNSDRTNFPTACVVMQDSDIGYFMLTSIGGQPQAATLDKPGVVRSEIFTPDYEEDNYHPDQSVLTTNHTRSAYQPPESLWEKSSLPAFFDKHLPSRQKKLMKNEIRLSAATLDLMTEAHRILSRETYQLGIAAADLFRRCERLQDELRHQINSTKDVAYRIEGLLGEDWDNYRVSGENSHSEQERGIFALQKRFKAATSRQENLVERYQKLCRKVARSASGDRLSEKEELWFEEIAKIQDSTFQRRAQKGDDREDKQSEEPCQRYKEAKELAQDLLSRAKEVIEERPRSEENENNSTDSQKSGRKMKIPPDIRKAKVDHVMHLLDRESALVEAAQSKLKQLSLTPLPAPV